MKKRQKIWIVVLLTLLAAAAVFFALFGSGGKDDAPQKGNLIVNGDFALTTDGEPDGWQNGAWVTSAGASYLEAVTLEDGTTAALVENAAANDARFEQTIAVRENATYRLTARVMAEGCGEGTKGANVSFSGVYGTSRDLHDTNGQWETLTLYGRTGKGQKEITVMARLGGYGAENTGKAWFTDVSLEQVETVPVGETVLDLATPAPSKKTDAGAPKTAKERSIPLLIGAAYLFYKKVITWHIPAAFIGTFAVCYLLKTGFDVNATLAQLLSGGLILGAFFMATDYSSSPATAKGKIVFGIGCGLLLFIFRACKKTPAEWCSYAILLMNVCSPLIERVTGNKSFGEVKK